MKKVHKIIDFDNSNQFNNQSAIEICELHIKPLKIIQDNSLFKAGIDAVLLSDFAHSFIKKDSTVMDLCSGNGIIPILLAGITQAKSICGIEIQDKCANLANESVVLNGLDARVKILNDDLKNAKKLFAHKSFDFVTCNPPYFKTNNDFLKKLDEKQFFCKATNPNRNAIQIARSEILCTIEDVAKASFWLLKDKGSLFLINRPDRLSDTIIALSKNRLFAKKLRFILPFEGEKPSMFMLQAVKQPNTQLTVEKNLIVYKEKGIYSDEVQKIYSI